MMMNTVEKPFMRNWQLVNQTNVHLRCYHVFSSVDIPNRYEPYVPGSNPGGGRDFPHQSRPVVGPSRPPIQWIPGLFPEGKAAGA
jgi:hypothetical protein